MSPQWTNCKSVPQTILKIFTNCAPLSDSATWCTIFRVCILGYHLQMAFKLHICIETTCLLLALYNGVPFSVSVVWCATCLRWRCCYLIINLQRPTWSATCLRKASTNRALQVAAMVHGACDLMNHLHAPIHHFQEVAACMGLDLGRIKVKRFADGEIYVQLQV